jgi:hypothetical protein
MIEQLEQELIGVVCLHCGMPTPLPVSTSGGRSCGSNTIKLNPHLSIVRCDGCGKEAPYLADEIIVIRGMNTLHTAA